MSNETTGFDSGNPLEDLYTEAQVARKSRVTKKVVDPSMRNALDATAKKMRETYTLPENWERTRGVALIDKNSNTLIGNFSEYINKIVPKTRKLIREHLPIAIDATEVMDGFLGVELSRRLFIGQSWENEHLATCHVLLDELMVEAPNVQLKLKTRLGVIQRAELINDTQFASVNGETIMVLPAGTNVWEAAAYDTRAAMRRHV